MGCTSEPPSEAPPALHRRHINPFTSRAQSGATSSASASQTGLRQLALSRRLAGSTCCIGNNSEDSKVRHFGEKYLKILKT